MRWTAPEPVIDWPMWTDQLAFYGGCSLLLISFGLALIHGFRFLRRVSNWKFELVALLAAASTIVLVWKVMAGYGFDAEGSHLVCGPPGDLLSLSFISNLNPGGIFGVWKTCQDHARLMVGITSISIIVMFIVELRYWRWESRPKR